MPLREFADILEALHGTYNRRELVSPDPLEFLYEYPDPADREIVAMVASSLAYGRVQQIRASIRRVLQAMNGQPRRFVKDSAPARMQGALRGFKHRFSTGAEMAALLGGVRKSLRRHGSIEKCFARNVRPDDATVLPALEAFTRELHEAAGGPWNHLLCDASKGGACKRLHLMLRWLVREDAVDPGGWRSVSPAKLVVPLDVHMHRIARSMGATRRNSADRRTALEVTAAFAAIAPHDPVRYDFCLTRLGIRTEMKAAEFVKFFEKKAGRVAIGNQ